eukprot:IDg6440t1
MKKKEFFLCSHSSTTSVWENEHYGKGGHHERSPPSAGNGIGSRRQLCYCETNYNHKKTAPPSPKRTNPHQCVVLADRFGNSLTTCSAKPRGAGLRAGRQGNK